MSVSFASASCSSNFSECSDEQICKEARYSKNGIWQWVVGSNLSRNEALRRRLKCNVGDRAIPTNASWLNTYNTGESSNQSSPSSNSISSSTSNSSSSYLDGDKVLKSVFNSFNYAYRKNIQRYLQSENYYNSTIDGKWGNNTKRALKKELGGIVNLTNKAKVDKELLRMASSSQSSYSPSSWLNTDKTNHSASNISNTVLCKKATRVNSGRLQWTPSPTYSRYVKEAKAKGLNCSVGAVVSSSNNNLSNSSSNTSSTSKKKKNLFLLGILGAAAIASGNGDSNAAAFMLGLSCGATGNQKPCNDALRKNTTDDDGFKWGNNYRTIGNNFYGDDYDFQRIGSSYLYERDDGVEFQKIGNTLYGDDGTECRNVGSLTYCD